MLTKRRARKHFIRACQSTWFERSKQLVELLNQEPIMTPYVASIVFASSFLSVPKSSYFVESEFKLKEFFNVMWAEGRIKNTENNIKLVCEGKTRNEITPAVFHLAFSDDELNVLSDMFGQMKELLATG